MPVGAIIGGVASLGSALIGSSSARSAARAEEALGRDALALQDRQYQQSREDLAPWRAAGSESLGMLMSGIRDGSLTNAPDPSTFREDPGYQFRLSEGLRGVEGSAAARGILQSGGTLRGVNNFAQGVADQQYGDWWNRERQVQGDTYNRLAGVAGTGQAAVNTGVQAGQNNAAMGSNTLGNIGQARASGYAGQGAAWQQGIGSLASILGGMKF